MGGGTIKDLYRKQIEEVRKKMVKPETMMEWRLRGRMRRRQIVGRIAKSLIESAFGVLILSMI